MKQKTTLAVEVEYEDTVTDPEAIAVALDRLMGTATSTPGILEEYGNPTIGEFTPPMELARMVLPADGRLPHFVSLSCQGQNCGMCHDLDQAKVPATHKVGEEIPVDDPFPVRHNLTCYVCCKHFVWIVGRSMTSCRV